MCDFRSVSKQDVVPTDIIFPHYLDEAYELLHSPKHQWFYKRGMTDEEVIVFKLSDTVENVAQCKAHLHRYGTTQY
jgi:hypothetical protein